MKTILSLLSLAFILGCAPYRSEFKINGHSFALPKDAKFDWLHFSLPTSNGVISLVVSNGVFRMNPAVIDAKTAHDVAVFNAGADFAAKLAGAVK